MSLIETRWEIPFAAAEATSDVLVEQELTAWSVFEDIEARRAWIVGLFGHRAEAEASATSLAALLPSAPLGPCEHRPLADSEWRDSYKLHFHPWQFGPLHWVPVWERDTYAVPEGHAALWLDPGLAFGTGNHESTRLCVERLVAWAELADRKGQVVDAGCGSGILALSAVKLGFSSVSGFDNDLEAVRVSQENAALNGVIDQTEFFVADLTRGLSGVQAQLVLANILANVLVDHAVELTGAVAPGGALVLSGILSTECADVRRAFATIAPDWVQESRSLGEWSDVLLRRPV